MKRMNTTHAIIAVLAALPLCSCAKDPTSTTTDTKESPTMNTAGKAIVAYFSATDTTKGVAERLAGAIGADIFEIRPAQPYSADDLKAWAGSL
jgi:hypothetical protein